MSEIIRDQAVVHGSPDAIWAIIEDAARLARVLPGAESIVSTGPDAFRGVLATKVQFLTVKADVDASFHDADRPRHLRLELAGRPRGLAGSFTVSIPFDLEPVDGPGGSTDHAQATLVRYAIDLQVTGRLASFGAPILRDTLRRQVAALVSNVERELAGSSDRRST
jgi:uncharacterized protein